MEFKREIRFQTIGLSLFLFIIHACVLPPSPQPKQIVLKAFDNPEDYVKEGLNQYEIKNYEVAAANFRKAIDMNPRFQPAHAWLGVTYVYLGMREKALQEFDAVIEINPQTKDAENSRKWIEKLRNPPVIAVAELKARYKSYYTGTKTISDMLVNKIFESGLYKLGGYIAGWQDLNTDNLCLVAMRKGANILILGAIDKLVVSVERFPIEYGHKPIFKTGHAEARIILQVYSTKSCELLNTFVESYSQDIYRKGGISDLAVLSDAVTQVLGFIFDKFVKDLPRIVF